MSKALEISSNPSVVVNTNRHKGTAMSRLLELADAYAMVVYQTKNPDSEEADAARTALLEAVEQLAGKSTAIDSQDLTIAYMAGRHDAQKSAVSEPDLLKCNIQPRPLSYPLSDYHKAMSEGPLHFTWTDKPHRLVYDLIAAVMYYSTPPAEAKQPLTDDEKSIELYLEQALEYVQMVERLPRINYDNVQILR